MTVLARKIRLIMKLRKSGITDTAVLAAAARVRVIHGHGMGVLRRALWEMLKEHPHVEKFYHAEQREGGAGATVVELKV